MRMLITAGADVNAKRSPGTPAIVPVVQDGNKTILRMLLEANCDVNIVQAGTNDTVLHLAVDTGRLSIFTSFCLGNVSQVSTFSL